MSTDRKPWLCEGSPWKTESAFWVWVRGVLRKGWSKHPIKLEYIKRYRKRIKNPVEKNAKRFPECWGMTCEICNKDTPQKDIEIDHRGESGSFTGLKDAEQYIAHLFLIDFDSIRPLCKPCHKLVNHQQKNPGMSFEDAKIAKEVIRLMKKENRKELLAILEQHMYTGLRNDEQRRKAIANILKEKQHEGL